MALARADLESLLPVILQANRLAAVCHDGLARAVRPALSIQEAAKQA